MKVIRLEKVGDIYIITDHKQGKIIEYRVVSDKLFDEMIGKTFKKEGEGVEYVHRMII